MTCATCGRENPPHLTFCQECGQRLGPRIAPPTPPIGLGAGEPPSVRRCRVCDTPNPPGLRYCTTCGSTLDPAPRATAAPATSAPRVSAAPSPAPPPAQAPPTQVPPAPPPIAPMRVVGLDAATAGQAPRPCARCGGLGDPGAQFCKFCGASMADPASAAPASPPAPLLPHERLELPRGVNGRGSTSAMPQAKPASPAASPEPARAPHPSPAPPRPPSPALSPSARPPTAGSGARPPLRGRLVVIAKSGADGPTYPIGDTVDVGRTEGHIIVAEDPYLSPRHVRIAWEKGKLVLRDLASTNGVFLRLAPARDMNGPRRAAADGAPQEVSVPLRDQDLILVGQQVLKFEVVKDGEAGLGPAVEHGTLLFGSPAAPRYARLGQRTVEGVTRDVYYVRKMETVLGRESGDVVFTEDPFLSRRHAAIRLLGRDGAPLSAGQKPPADELRFSLVDLGSSNGTFLRVSADVELVTGDHFRVGQQLFRVDYAA